MLLTNPYTKITQQIKVRQMKLRWKCQFPRTVYIWCQSIQYKGIQDQVHFWFIFLLKLPHSLCTVDEKYVPHLSTFMSMLIISTSNYHHNLLPYIHHPLAKHLISVMPLNHFPDELLWNHKIKNNVDSISHQQ